MPISQVQKLVFITDHRFIEFDKRIFSLAFNNITLSRYSKYSSVFHVIGNKIVSQTSNSNLAELDIDNVQFNLLYPIKKIYEIVTIGSRKKCIKNVIKDSDFIISRLPSVNGIHACQIAIKKGIPFIVEIVGDVSNVAKVRNSIFGRIYGYFQKVQIDQILKHCNLVIFVTENYLQEQYRYEGKSIGISNVSLPSVQENLLTERIEKIRTERKTFKIGFVGSISSKNKGFTVLLDAFNKLLKKNYDLSIEVVGNNKLDSSVKSNLNNERVELIGTLTPGISILKWLDAIDIFVIPSYSEGLPRVLIEAMSRALPCFGSNAGGIPELIGFDQIHKAGDSNQLARSIAIVLDNENLMIELAKVNFIRAKSFQETKLQKTRDHYINDFIQREVIK